MSGGNPTGLTQGGKETVDQRAPVVGTSEIVIAAPPETVWDVLAAIQDWPSWDPDVKWVRLDAEIVPGTQFRWKSGPGTITSTLQRVERPREIAWTGRTYGINAYHVYRFEPQNGATRVETEESFYGLLPRLFRGWVRKTLIDALESGLRHLKAEAERRAQR